MAHCAWSKEQPERRAPVGFGLLLAFAVSAIVWAGLLGLILGC